MQPPSPGSDTGDRVYACSHCPKRYVRKDYLERHELNHTRPASICPACGKGFARPDVLRKHLSTSCKSRRGSDGDAPAPLTIAEEDALVPRKRRRPQRRATNHTSAPSQSADSGSPSSDDGSTPQRRPPYHNHSQSYTSSSSNNNRYSPIRYTPQHSTHPQHNGHSTHNGILHGTHGHPSITLDGRLARSDSDDRLEFPSSATRFSRPSLDLDARFGGRVPLQQTNNNNTASSPSARFARPTDPGADQGPARAGASLDLPLAPAFAATPETLGTLSFTPKGVDEWNGVNNVHVNGGPPHPVEPVQANGVHPAANGVYPPAANGVHFDTTPAPTGAPLGDTWNPTNEAGNNMDDLFSWLFNIANSSGGAPGSWPQQQLPGAVDIKLEESALAGVGSHEYAEAGFGERRAWAGGHHPGGGGHDLHAAYSRGYQHDHPDDIDPDADVNTPTSSQSKSSSRGPPQTHPRADPFTGAQSPYPSFPESWESEAGTWRLPAPAEVLDARARGEILDLFEGAAREDLTGPAFSLGQMKLYLELYFMHFAPLYPIIHRPSLGYRRLPPDLLLTMLCIGTAFADDKDGFRIATRIHKRLRHRVFERVEDEPRAPIAALQTILLINHFSRSYCSLKEHDVAQIFHSPSIIMARLAGVFLPTFADHPSARNPLDHWLEWVALEERKRCGWLAFMMDTESAAIFRDYLLVHCFTVQIDWPSDDGPWFATEPFAWSRAQRSARQPPSFRTALREIAGRGAIAASMSELQLWILLHGLISVSWTLLWRDLGDLSMIHESKITHWKDSLRRAFGAFRDHTQDMFARRLANDDAPLDMHIYWTGIPFAHLGCILLLSDTESIRIFAGESNIAGRPISPGEWANASTYVVSWARSQDGAYSCSAAVELLSQVFKWSHEARFMTAPSVIPWCLYIASLIIWSYSTALEGPARLLEPYILPLASPTANPPQVKIEPSLARRDALDYLARLGQAAPFDLPDMPGKNRCAGVMAYTAYLAGTLGRGVMDESRNVLLRLLVKGQ